MRRSIFSRTITAAFSALFITSATSALPGEDDASRTQTLLSVFAQTCLTNVGQPKRLIAQSSPSGTKPLAALSAAQAFPFLRDHSGYVWALPKSAGRAVIVLRNDGLCTLFVRRWAGTNIEAHIAALFRNIEVFNLEEARRIDGALSMVSYDLIPAGSYKKRLDATTAPAPTYHLIAKTNRAPKAAAQLAITLSTKRR